MFGMGTGGSLRLLSPEIVWGSRPSLPRFLLTPVGIRTASRLPFSAFAPGFDTLCLAPSKPHRLVSLRLSDQDRLRSPSHSLSQTFFVASVLWLASFLPPSQASFNSTLHSPNSTLFQDQALDRLVSPSSIRYRTSTDDLSTLSSSRGLTCF